MASSGVPICTNDVYKNSNIITLVAIIIIMLSLYRGIQKPVKYIR